MVWSNPKILLPTSRRKVVIAFDGSILRWTCYRGSREFACRFLLYSDFLYSFNVDFQFFFNNVFLNLFTFQKVMITHAFFLRRQMNRTDYHSTALCSVCQSVFQIDLLDVQRTQYDVTQCRLPFPVAETAALLQIPQCSFRPRAKLTVISTAAGLRGTTSPTTRTSAQPSAPRMTAIMPPSTAILDRIPSRPWFVKISWPISYSHPFPILHKLKKHHR